MNMGRGSREPEPRDLLEVGEQLLPDDRVEGRRDVAAPRERCDSVGKLAPAVCHVARHVLPRERGETAK